MPENLPLFPPGNIVSTPGALRALAEAGAEPLALIARHLRGDFGVLCAEDLETNRLAVACGDRVLSNYLLPTGQSLWVITESDRSVTTLLLPNEY